jgi:hypothetical protein
VWSRAVAGVSGDPMVTSCATHVLAYRARFRGLRVKVMGGTQTLKCEMVIELRRLSVRSQLFGMFHAASAKRLTPHGYSLRDAKACVEGMFAEKLDGWQEVTAPDPLSGGERK